MTDTWNSKTRPAHWILPLPFVFVSNGSCSGILCSCTFVFRVPKIKNHNRLFRVVSCRVSVSRVKLPGLIKTHRRRITACTKPTPLHTSINSIHTRLHKNSPSTTFYTTTEASSLNLQSTYLSSPLFSRTAQSQTSIYKYIDIYVYTQIYNRTKRYIHTRRS